MFERYKIKKLLKPRKEFAEQTKAAFLAVYERAHPMPIRVGGVGALAKSLIAGGALIAIFASMSVYADTANVAADSPLYPLKRLGESVELAVAPAPEKAELQATFAVRRASEITDLEMRKPSSTQIASLSSDLNTALNSSLKDAQSADLGDGKLTSFCDKILSAIATSSVEVHSNSRRGSGDGASALSVSVVGRFLGQCSKTIIANASTSVSTTANASTTVNATATLPLLPRLPFSFPRTPSGTIFSSTTVNFHASGTRAFPPRSRRGERVSI